MATGLTIMCKSTSPYFLSSICRSSLILSPLSDLLGIIECGTDDDVEMFSDRLGMLLLVPVIYLLIGFAMGMLGSWIYVATVSDTKWAMLIVGVMCVMCVPWVTAHLYEVQTLW